MNIQLKYAKKNPVVICYDHPNRVAAKPYHELQRYVYRHPSDRDSFHCPK